MSFLAKCVEVVQYFDRKVLSVAPHIPLAGRTRDILAKHQLIVADVGAAGGVDPRWRSLSGFVRFLAFEPRCDEAISNPDLKRFSMALAAQQGRRRLYVTKFSQSSSLFPLNRELLNDFTVHDCYDLVRTEEVAVDTLDHCLAGWPADRPDFLKVDVEGAELEVLRGGEAVLKESVLGVRTEVSFAPRHLGAPLFGEVDAFLRQRGYMLLVLNRELMIRDGRVHSPISQPQCVWGDALYFLTWPALSDRLRAAPVENREWVVVKFVATLCAHGAHDYAAQIIAASGKADLIAAPVLHGLMETVHGSVRGARRYFWKALSGFVFSLIVWVVALPSTRMRAMARPYVRRRAGYVLHYLWRISARTGACDGSISDLQV
ncbi:MAG: FkbM family methyltransferase [Verrucomicrobia bacterium]|nr:FkbM family methyltransferase [Verrucomicrobiota bacterium]